MFTEVLQNYRQSIKLQYLVSFTIAILLLILLLVIINNNLLLIIVIELISIAVGVSIFMLVWNSRRNVRDSFLIALGLSFLFTAVLDTLFTISIMDTSVLQEFSFNNAIQIGIAARYFQAFTLLIAAVLVGRNLTKKGSFDTAILIPLYAVTVLLLTMSILVWHNFPACELHGYTPFKIGSEYVISAIFIAIAAIHVKKRKFFDSTVWFYFFIALILMIAGELAFAISGSGFALTNFLGFCLRFVALYFFYRAIVVVGISNPFYLLFHELKERDSALRASEERYRNVVEDQTELISRFLPDGTHVFVNNAYCRFFERTRDEVIGKKMQLLVHPDDKDMVRDTVASLSRKRPFITATNRILLPNGSVRWVRWTDRAIFNADGKITEYQSVGRDITKLKEAGEALGLAHRKLALLSSITRHDLLNQLTALKSYIELLKNAPRDSDPKGYLDKMETISEVIEEQITFTKDYETMGMSSPVWQAVSASINRSIASLPMRDVRTFSDVRDLEVFADPLFEKVFYNLIDNALRYGGTKMTLIKIHAEAAGDEMVLVCEDDGNGISHEDKKRLFEKGFGHHTGLGLFLVREILSITAITISENGMPGKGARFEIRVPKGSFRYAGQDCAETTLLIP
ncbi:MASE3 domain-containing protein [Methanoregula sp.]|uniref:MASE3 domain-containing protein n=1 Tax=Methanoregula sp. TaxID=2052170 RepID=UPI0035624A40